MSLWIFRTIVLLQCVVCSSSFRESSIEQENVDVESLLREKELRREMHHWDRRKLFEFVVKVSGSEEATRRMVREASVSHDVHSVRSSSFLDLFVHRYTNEIERRLNEVNVMIPERSEYVKQAKEKLLYEDDEENEKEIWDLLLLEDNLESKFLLASCLLFRGERYRVHCENNQPASLNGCDTKSALHLLKQVASDDFAEAQTYVALFLMSPFSSLDDENLLRILRDEEGIVLLDKAAAQGDLLALMSLGYHYLKENSCSKAVSNYIDVARVTMDEIALSGNDVTLPAVLLEDLENDSILKEGLKDEIKTVQYYEELALQGDAEASYTVGELLLYGDVVGIPANTEAAQQHFQRAVDLGIPEAHVMLGSIELDAENGNLTKARLHFEKALDSGVIGAYTSLGFLYLEGLGVEKNETKAFELFKHAADEEVSSAFSNLAVMYLQGIGVQQNVTQAVELLERGHQFGHLPASYVCTLHVFSIVYLL